MRITTLPSGAPFMALAFVALSAAAQSRGADAPPNVLLCIADDWGWPHAGNYVDDQVRTPAINRLAAEGVLFENAFTTAPSCTPSRNALLTGQYQWRLGQGINLWSTLHKRHQVYPHLLQSRGYEVGHCRKTWGPGDWRAEGREKHPFGEVHDSFQSFMKGRDPQRPFCFTLGTSDPHRPYDAGSGARAGIDVSAVKVPGDLPDHPDVRGDIADYYTEVHRFDSDIGAALRLLEQDNLLDNTLIVVTSDHGMPFPRHKANLYDSGTRVPLIIRWGGAIPAGRVVTDYVDLTDLAPTFLDAAGATVPAVMTGKSLMPVLRSDKEGWVDTTRDRVLMGIERHGQTQELPNPGGYPSRAMRTKDYLYIRNYEPKRWPGGCPDPDLAFNGREHGTCDDGPTKAVLTSHRDSPELSRFYDLAFAKRPAEELYLIATDPFQTENVAQDPKYSEVLERLREELASRLMETGDPRVGPDSGELDLIPYRGYRKRSPPSPKASAQ